MLTYSQTLEKDAEELVKIRIISLRAFFERLPPGAAVAIEESTNPDVKKAKIGMKLTAYVDLDSPLTLHDLGDIMLDGILNQAEFNAMLVDGEEYEK